MLVEQLMSSRPDYEFKILVEIACNKYGVELDSSRRKIYPHGGFKVLARAYYWTFNGMCLNEVQGAVENSVPSRVLSNTKVSEYFRMAMLSQELITRVSSWLSDHYLNTKQYEEKLSNADYTSANTIINDQTQLYKFTDIIIDNIFDITAYMFKEDKSLGSVYSEIPEMVSGLITNFKSHKVYGAANTRELRDHPDTMVLLLEDFSKSNQGEPNYDNANIDLNNINMRNIIGFRESRYFIPKWATAVLPTLHEPQTIEYGGNRLDRDKLQNINLPVTQDDFNIHDILQDCFQLSKPMFENKTGGTSDTGSMSLQYTVIEWYLSKRVEDAVQVINSDFDRFVNSPDSYHRKLGQRKKTIASPAFEVGEYQGVKRQATMLADFQKKMDGNKRLLEMAYNYPGGITAVNFVDFIDKVIRTSYVEMLTTGVPDRSNSASAKYLKFNREFVMVDDKLPLLKGVQFALNASGMSRARMLVRLRQDLTQLEERFVRSGYTVFDLPSPSFVNDATHQNVLTVKGTLNSKLFELPSTVLSQLDDGTGAGRLLLYDRSANNSGDKKLFCNEILMEYLDSEKQKFELPSSVVSLEQLKCDGVVRTTNQFVESDELSAITSDLHKFCDPVVNTLGLCILHLQMRVIDRALKCTTTEGSISHEYYSLGDSSVGYDHKFKYTIINSFSKDEILGLIGVSFAIPLLDVNTREQAGNIIDAMFGQGVFKRIFGVLTAEYWGNIGLEIDKKPELFWQFFKAIGIKMLAQLGIYELKCDDISIPLSLSPDEFKQSLLASGYYEGSVNERASGIVNNRLNLLTVCELFELFVYSTVFRMSSVYGAEYKVSNMGNAFDVISGLVNAIELKDRIQNTLSEQILSPLELYSVKDREPYREYSDYIIMVVVAKMKNVYDSVKYLDSLCSNCGHVYQVFKSPVTDVVARGALDTLIDNLYGSPYELAINTRMLVQKASSLHDMLMIQCGIVNNSIMPVLKTLRKALIKHRSILEAAYRISGTDNSYISSAPSGQSIMEFVFEGSFNKLKADPRISAKMLTAKDAEVQLLLSRLGRVSTDKLGFLRWPNGSYVAYGIEDNGEAGIAYVHSCGLVFELFQNSADITKVNPITNYDVKRLIGSR